MKRPLFTGAAALLPIPTDRSEADLLALQRLIGEQVRCGSDALILTGGSALSVLERQRCLSQCVRQVAGRVSVLFALTTEERAAAKAAAEAGADGLLLSPADCPRDPETALRQTVALTSAVSVPVILDGFSIKTALALAAEETIIGLRVPPGGVLPVRELKPAFPEDFFFWSGSVADTALLSLLGGRGVISELGASFPRALHILARLCLEGDYAEAEQLRQKLERRQLAAPPAADGFPPTQPRI